MSEVEQRVNEIVSSTRERIVNRFVGGEAIKWILEASPEIVEECLRQRIKKLEDALAYLHKGAWSPSPKFMRNLGLEPFDFEAVANNAEDVKK